MKYIYGPLASRRLGFSLGVSLIPHKTCDFDCVYCQLGSTSVTTTTRKEYVDKGQIITEIKEWLKNNPEQKIDYITFSGYGEPTLNIKIGEIIQEIKTLTTIPVAVITNSSLLVDPDLRRSLYLADLLVPSLDATSQDIFEKIDRPAEGIRVENIIDALIALRKEYTGKLWLEVMLVADYNDDLEHAKKLSEVIARINPDKIQLNTPVRHTALAGIRPPDVIRLREIKEILGPKCEVV